MQKISVESLKEGINKFKGVEDKKNLAIDELAGDVDINLQLIRTGNKVRVKGRIKFSLKLECSRCLAEFICDKVGDIDTLFIPYSHDEISDPDMFFYEHKMIDIQEVVHDTILLSVPIKALCTEDCKGICPCCGKNLNEGDCTCHPIGDNEKIS